MHGGTPYVTGRWHRGQVRAMEDMNPEVAELSTVAGSPNIAERIVRVVRDLAAIIALVLVSLLMILALSAVSKLSRAAEFRSPGTAVTGCPFGYGQCGG